MPIASQRIRFADVTHPLLNATRVENDVQYQNWNQKKLAWETDVAVEEILRDYFNLKVSLVSLYQTWGAADPHFKKVSSAHLGVRFALCSPPRSPVFGTSVIRCLLS